MSTDLDIDGGGFSDDYDSDWIGSRLEPKIEIIEANLDPNDDLKVYIKSEPKDEEEEDEVDQPVDPIPKRKPKPKSEPRRSRPRNRGNDPRRRTKKRSKYRHDSKNKLGNLNAIPNPNFSKFGFRMEKTIPNQNKLFSF